MRVKTICVMYVIMVCLVLTSCCTAKPITDGLVIEHSRQLAVLEAGIRSYGETVSAVAGEIAAVKERAEVIGETIDATIELFDEYQQAIDRPISDYNALRTTVDVQQNQSLTDLSSSIAANLEYLKLESEVMLRQLALSHEKLLLSETERQRQEQLLTQLSSSLTGINEQLTDAYLTITRYEQQLMLRNKIIIVLLVVMVIVIVIVIGYIVYAKGIYIPRWLDILL